MIIMSRRITMTFKWIIKKIKRRFIKKEIIPIVKTVRSENFLENRVALITGGNGGIGFAIAKKFIDCGCKVIIAGRDEDKLKKKSSELGNKCSYVILDLYKISSFKEIIDGVEDNIGKIDILVNSAGMHIPRNDLAFNNINEKEYDQIMDLNLKGTYFISQCVSDKMRKNKIKGNILFISSQSGLEPAWSPYRLSKWGIKGMVEGLAQSLYEFGIIVNGIGPGPTATDMQSYKDGDSIFTRQNPIERYTMPDEIAEYAVMLVSNMGSTIVGDIIYMSGGRGIIELR